MSRESELRAYITTNWPTIELRRNMNYRQMLRIVQQETGTSPTKFSTEGITEGRNPATEAAEAAIDAADLTPIERAIPKGGLVGYVLKKASDASFDVGWEAESGGGGGSGTVTSVGLIDGGGLTISGSPITTSGSITVGLPASGVGAGSYTAADITVDTYGRITAASSNTLTSGTVTSVGLSSTDLTVVGSPITTAGTITLNLQTQGGFTPQMFLLPDSITVNDKGIITAVGGIADATPITGSGNWRVNNTLTVNGDSFLTGRFQTGSSAYLQPDTSLTTTTYHRLDDAGGVIAIVLPLVRPPGTPDEYGRHLWIQSVQVGHTLTCAGTDIFTGEDIAGGQTVFTFTVAGESVHLFADAGPDGYWRVLERNLPASGVTADTYYNPTLTVDVQGRITAASSGEAYQLVLNGQTLAASTTIANIDPACVACVIAPPTSTHHLGLYGGLNLNPLGCTLDSLGSVQIHGEPGSGGVGTILILYPSASVTIMCVPEGETPSPSWFIVGSDQVGGRAYTILP